MDKQKIVVFSGAGMSAESGIMTFREMGGLWEQYDVTEVASPIAWENSPQLVMDFYNQRRKQLFECEPNEGHLLIAKLEDKYDVEIVTQNVDDLHERAGSSKILHLHGELKKARSTADESLVYEMDHWELKLGDVCEKGSQLRPHIVWFGEAVPAMDDAIELVRQADIVLVVGTSLSVYPAAGLLSYIENNIPIYVIDPGSPAFTPKENITFIAEKASVGMEQLTQKLF
ncbi:SIR2 family NAD-dependent protein deacylase [Labilibacter marinus]|uniref:SIR2 family NAD-dependent protein deacylase n=1 Tax=Labilibacter marinus TaxID=1477105 RepID=UPI00094F7E91|nr:NAD-dependent deacylase [Labilibacter marinus]